MHDSQVITDDFPPKGKDMMKHDVPVDIICHTHSDHLRGQGEAAQQAKGHLLGFVVSGEVGDHPGLTGLESQNREPDRYTAGAGGAGGGFASAGEARVSPKQSASKEAPNQGGQGEGEGDRGPDPWAQGSAPQARVMSGKR